MAQPTTNASIWFDQLSDGTIACIGDVILQEFVVVQPTRCTLSEPFNMQCATYAAQYIRQRFPELNRTEFASLSKSCRFDRVTQPERKAAKAVRLEHLDHETEQELQRAVDAEVLDAINSHPTELGLLQWKMSFHTTSKGDKTSLYIVFACSHNHVDGVSIQRLTGYFLSAYVKSLQSPESPLPKPERLPLYSFLPQEHVKLSKWQSAFNKYISGVAARGVRYLQPKCPWYKKDVVQEEYRHQVLTHTIPAQKVKELLNKCRSRKLTIGTAIHACMFYNTATAYYATEGANNKWSLKIGMSKNMRPYLDPPLPPTVIAPQQGSIDVIFNSVRGDETLEGKEKSEKIWEWASHSRKTLLDSKPMDAISGELLLAYMIRDHYRKLKPIEYIGDMWFSNVGLFTPPPELADAGITIESTYTVNIPAKPAYDILWSNTVKGGDMVLSMAVDTTVRNLKGAQSFLEDVVRTIDIL